MNKCKYDERASLPQQTFYVPTAIAYLNGKPHIGHAYEIIVADVIARYHRLAGRQTILATGSDEHGQKVEQVADANNTTPQQWCDKIVESFKDLNSKLNIGPHIYIRTTNPRHELIAQQLWRLCRAKGDIYLSQYSGWYNIKEETFVTDRDAEAHGYKCPDTGIAYEKRSEAAYFFRMSKYHDEVEKLISNDAFIKPASRRKELLNRLQKSRLEDLCISRSTLKWGIPVPDDPDHVMYVWFDALTNYLSVLALFDGDESSELQDIKAFKKYWPANVHVIGKDIIWFHCVIWPSMLMSAGIPVPRSVNAHGFVQAADGQKMSKSLGNTISPLETLNKVSADTFRYYLMREGTFGQDIRFSLSALVDMHNADLCSVIGNLVHRVIALTVSSCGGKVPQDEPETFIVKYDEIFEKAENIMSELTLEEYSKIGLEICREINKYMSEREPWKIKAGRNAPAFASRKQCDGEDLMTVEEAASLKASIIRASLEALYIAAHYLEPVMPVTAETIFTRMGTERKTLAELKKGTNLVPGTPVKSSKEILFTPYQVETLVG